jgi:hypothetical protein
MFIIVPLLCFVLIFLCFLHKTGDTGTYPCWRRAFLSSALVWGILLTFITEILSAFEIFTFDYVLGLWVLASLVSGMIFWTLRKKNKVGAIRLGAWGLGLGVRNLESGTPSPKPHPSSLILLSGVCLIIAAVGLVAIVAPPNNYDSMTYHMSRVAHWIQNQSVAHYPTNIQRQLYLNPWAEFAITHFQILAGGDRFANLVQWLAFIGSILGVSLIAKHLGAGIRGQVFASVVCATIPMAILQSSSTQNDLVVSFWLVCFVCCLLLFRKNPGWAEALGIGASLGLAVLTKGTAYFFAFPFLIWLAYSAARKLRLKSWKPVFIVTTLVLMINLGHYMRNIYVYKTPFAIGDHKCTNETMNPAALISSITRNIGLHLDTPVWRVNIAIEKGIIGLHNLIGMDINDPRTTFNKIKFRIKKPSTHEDHAANPLHLAFIIVSLMLLLSVKPLRKRLPLIYMTAVTSAFLLFCLLLKWQPWHSRLHLPLFILCAPLAAVAFSQIRVKWIGNMIIPALMVSSLYWVMCNETRPMLGRNSIFTETRLDLYFACRNPGFRENYIAAADFIKKREYRSIGLATNEDSWEYPLWALLKANSRNIRIEHYNVNNESGAIQSAPFVPDVLICIDQKQERIAEYIKEFAVANRFGLVSVLEK